MKQNEQGTLNINFLIQANDEKNIRDFLLSHQIIILSLTSYNKDAKTYGPTYVTIKLKNDQTITVVSDKESLEEAATIFAGIGFEISSINSIINPLNQQQIDAILSKAQVLKITKQQEEQKRKEIKKAQVTKKYSSAEKIKLDKVVVHTLQDIQIMLQHESNGVNKQFLAELQTLDADLRKLKNSSNTETIVKTLENIFTLMEKIELQHVELLKESEIKIINESIVTNVDIKQEIDSFKKAQVVKTAGTKQSARDKYYVFLGSLGMYNRFLKKDMFAKLKKISNVLNMLVSMTKNIFILTAILIGLFIFFSQIINNYYPERLLLYLVHIASLSIAFSIWHKWKSQNILIVIGQIIAAIITYFLLSTLIILNFSLT